MTREDLPRVLELQGEWKWTFGGDFISGLVAVDEEDKIVAVLGAWRLAEVHMLMDTEWRTPAFRHQAELMLQEAMTGRLYLEKVGRMVTWMGAPMRAFERRMQKWGWVRSEAPSFHKGVR
jgi:hypothetical protein